MNRDAIFAAVFALAAGAPGLVTSERKLKHFNRYVAADQPVLNFWHGPETATPVKGGGPMKWEFRPELYLYVWGGNDESAVTADTQVCDLIDYMTTVFAPPMPGLRQTLGGLVDEATIEGTIKVDEAADLPQIVCVVPLCILVAA